MQHDGNETRKHGWTHWLWMALCCSAMLAVIVLMALGYWSLP